jgi:excinuclease ABC subunit A
MENNIVIRGAHEHNLKNVNLEIPKNKLVVFTGISGSGKSSLAFDTIYAEGQRRYVESLSSYARQFLGVMNKPEVDYIEGLSPSISIDQKFVSHNPRSTVGTITEIYDYLRLLYARIGQPYCPHCDLRITKLSTDEIVGKIFNYMENVFQKDPFKPLKLTLKTPLVRQRKGEFSGLLDNLRSKGFQEAFIDGNKYNLNKEILLIKTNKHTIDVIIDKFSLNNKNIRDQIFKSNFHSRLFNSLEQGLNLSNGLITLVDEGNKTQHLFSQKLSCPNCNLSLPEIEPRMFSFNSPLGACEKCKGLGYITQIDPELVLNKKLSINEGGILPFSRIFFHTTWFSRLFKTFLDDVGINPNIPIRNLDNQKLKLLLWGGDKVYRVEGLNRFGRETSIWEKFPGIIPELERRYFESKSDYTRAEIEKYIREKTCDKCQGKRLKSEILSIKIEQNNIFELSELSVDKMYIFFEQLEKKLNQYEKKITKLIINEIKNRLEFLKNVGLNYLTVSRSARSLAGGESQRIRLASQIGSGLSGVIYVLDEPSIGLHPKDINALISTLRNLRNLGNTIIVVEHDPETISAADFIVDFGPYAGKKGGKIVFKGTVEEIKKNKQSLTGQYLSGAKSFWSPAKGGTIESERDAIATLQHYKNGVLSISGCRQYNLKNITVNFPLGHLICVTGVSGSGKSTLITETLYPALRYYLEGNYKEQIGVFENIKNYQYIDKVYLVDQSSIGKTPRSNPATYIGLFNYIRDLFSQTTDARSRGYKKGRFSFNVKGGRCEKCSGAGTIKIEMQFLPDVYVKCDVCRGRRYNSETLEVRYKGKNIDDILNFTVDEALDFFKSHPLIFNKLKILQDVGLGYIELGQPAPTLSGGEAQRIKLARELSKKETGRALYLLDEPTTGLHFYDIEKLLATLYKLVERGNTVIIIEHNLEVIKNCQYIIDLGPEGGERGGKIIYQGLINGILSVKNSYTGQYLNKNVSII